MKKDIEQQFLQIWNDYHDEIYRYVISMLSDTGEAEECTQDVFLILWKLMQERTMYNPRVWLYKTANHKALQRRTKKQENAFDFDNMEYMLFDEEGFQSLDSGVDTEELYQSILKELTASERWLLRNYERRANKGTATVGDKIRRASAAVLSVAEKDHCNTEKGVGFHGLYGRNNLRY